MRPICPECEATFDLPAQQARVGTLFFCPECQTELEIITESPLEVAYVREPLSDDEWFGGTAPRAPWQA